jgi:hypothetical protein
MFSYTSTHKVHIYVEYHSVCPLVGIVTPHSLSRKRMCPPSGTKGGGDTLVCGWGPISDDWRKSLALSLLYASTYPIHHTIQYERELLLDQSSLPVYN